MILNEDFYQQETVVVAEKLLGKRLVRVLPSGERLAGRIVETEAYLGAEDPACHTFGYRKTARTSTMFLMGGTAYVYLIYGMYNCFNVVTRRQGEPEAVLVRAIEPVEGLEVMQKLRPVSSHLQLGNGPGKMCQAMAIDRALDGLSLQGPEVFIEDNILQIGAIEARPRVGVGYAGDAAFWPLRFSIKNNPYVSPAP